MNKYLSQIKFMKDELAKLSDKPDDVVKEKLNIHASHAIGLLYRAEDFKDRREIAKYINHCLGEIEKLQSPVYQKASQVETKIDKVATAKGYGSEEVTKLLELGIEEIRDLGANSSDAVDKKFADGYVMQFTKLLSAQTHQRSLPRSSTETQR